MKKFCSKWASILFTAVFFTAAVGLSLCLHGGESLHFTPTKTQACSDSSVNFAPSIVDDNSCIDFGFDIGENFTSSKSLVKSFALLTDSDVSEIRTVPIPEAQLVIVSFINAPPDIVLGELYNNIVSRLLI